MSIASPEFPSCLCYGFRSLEFAPSSAIITITVLHLTQCEPPRNSPCLCGSGKNFKNCCRGSYSSEGLDRSIRRFNEGDYTRALAECRSHVTWYVIAHRAHTVPLLQRGEPAGIAFLEIDIKALSEIVDVLHRCLYRAGEGNTFPLALDQLRSAIDSPRWHERIQYFRALWHLVDQGDPGAAMRELAGIDIESCFDADVLELYIDVAPVSLPFSQRIEVIDRIIENTQKEPERLQYSLLKGVFHCLICQFEDGLRYIRSAIKRYRSFSAEKRTRYGDLFLARALATLGRLEDDPSSLCQAIVVYERLVQACQERGGSEEYLAELEKSLGDCHLDLGESLEAIGWYRRSLDRAPTGLTRVFLARALIDTANLRSARATLAEVDISGFDDNCMLDLALVSSKLAIQSTRDDDWQQAVALLKRTNPPHPLFRQYKDSALLGLFEIQRGGSPNRLSGVLSSFSRYFLLSPNFFGLGLNLNNVLDDARDAMARRRHQQQDLSDGSA